MEERIKKHVGAVRRVIVVTDGERILGLDENAAVIHNLQGTGPGAFAPITSAEQRGDTLYLGSLTETRFAAYSLADAARTPR